MAPPWAWGVGCVRCNPEGDGLKRLPGASGVVRLSAFGEPFAIRVRVAQRNVEIVIGRLITDEAFRSAFRENPIGTLTRFTEAGYELTALEISALRTTHAGVWARAAEAVDPRLQKAALGGTR